MSVGRTLRKVPEAILTWVGIITLPYLPRRAILALSRFFGRAAYCLSRHLRRVGLANLDIAFGDAKSASEKKAILRQSFQSFALVTLDLFWFSRRSAERIQDWVRVAPEFDPLLSGDSHVCITGHLGNWEIIGQAVTAKGCPLASVAAPLANTLVDGAFNRMRKKTGQQVVPVKGAVRKLMQALRDGRSVALLLDQNTKPSHGGIFVDFFGLPVPVSSAPAALSLRTKSPVFFGFCIPGRDGIYQTHTAPGIPASDFPSGDRDIATRQLTERITAVVEKEVRTHAGSWLWMYKRWKYVAPGRAREEYPFYAKELLPRDRELAEEDLDIG